MPTSDLQPAGAQLTAQNYITYGLMLTSQINGLIRYFHCRTIKSPLVHYRFGMIQKLAFLHRITSKRQPQYDL